MTAFDDLTREFGDAGVASAIIESLLEHGLEVRTGITGLRRGNSGARLAKAQLASVSGPRNPRWCVIKYSESMPLNHQRDSRQHLAALQESPRKFREKHLTRISFPAIRCDQNALVTGQSVVDGIPLGAVQLDQLGEVCEVVWKTILTQWAGPGYDSARSTLAELLTCELGDSFRSDGWLHDWAHRHGLLGPAFLQLPDEPEPLPNPWRLFAEDSPATRAEIDYLIGRTHGDLHGDNILVSEHDGTVLPSDFRLIDLATYDGQAPLSRDLATLMISLCWREIGASSSHGRETFLAYLERDHRDERLDGGMPGFVRQIIDALREPALRFVAQKEWDSSHWHRQLKVSLLAQAMLHSAYETATPEANRWCSRLAGRLTRELLGPVDPRLGPSMDFDAGKILRAVGTTATPTTDRPARDGSIFVDRAGQRIRLSAALEDQLTSVIVVSGPPGIGKTALVREVLAYLDLADSDDETSPVHWHDATPYGEVDVSTLLKDIEPRGLGRVAGPTGRARLEIALDNLYQTDGIRPVIVIDSAENLLNEGHTLRDSELDLALEAVHRRRRPLIKVVFVTQHMPEATTGVAWTGTACRINLDGLEPLSLREHFAELDPDNRYGLAALPEKDLWHIHGLLAGNPRLAELLHAVLSSDPPGLQADEVGTWLSSGPASDVHQRLVHLFVDHLPTEQRLAAKGLAALGIPVHTDAVVSVLKPYLPPARIEPALQALVATRLVLQGRDGRRYVRRTEAAAIFGQSRRDRLANEGEPSTERDLILQAARVLATMQTDDDDVNGMIDLEMHFARTDAWLRAGMYEQAHSLIADMDELVHIWGSGVELRTQREAVRGRLGDEREDEMRNLAALGDIYSYSGDFHSAQVAYQAAITIAREDQYREAMSQIYIGMGTMFWEHDHLADAEKCYGLALEMVGEVGDDDGDGELHIDRAAAQLGLADCRQRHGQYQRAVVDALEAFVAAVGSHPRLAADAALRLTRWYAELDRMPDARAMLARCADLIPDRRDPSAQAELLTSTADLLLYRDLYRDARSAAEDAVACARDHRDPINLRRSLTTLALAHMHLDEFSAAHKAIEESARYRVAGRETVELALRAIIAHRCDLPATARDLFRQLHDETSERTRADSNDLAAWDFTGVARCYAVLIGETESGTALDAFHRARPEQADPTPALDDLLRFMVQTLGNGDARIVRVLADLAQSRPGRIG
ncbi:MAG TPA: AAA family ATPase [Pseudonocardiaceae bacterium]|nr:AAA family ATPase [Pseudonocardiaceae bacterium]